MCSSLDAMYLCYACLFTSFICSFFFLKKTRDTDTSESPDKHFLAASGILANHEALKKLYICEGNQNLGKAAASYFTFLVQITLLRLFRLHLNLPFTTRCDIKGKEMALKQVFGNIPKLIEHITTFGKETSFQTVPIQTYAYIFHVICKCKDSVDIFVET